jgi:hypothetical protein
LVERKNATSSSFSSKKKTGMKQPNQEHFSFLKRVQARLMKAVSDEEKGIKKPLSTNKLTQKMFARAKLERDTKSVQNDEAKKDNSTQGLS